MYENTPGELCGTLCALCGKNHILDSSSKLTAKVAKKIQRRERKARVCEFTLCELCVKLSALCGKKHRFINVPAPPLLSRFQRDRRAIILRE